MRSIGLVPILMFEAACGLELALSIVISMRLYRALGPSEYRAMIVAGVGLVLFVVFNLALLGIVARSFRLKTGFVERGSGQERLWHFYALHWLFLYRPLIGSGVLPGSLSTLMYRVQGLRCGGGSEILGKTGEPFLITAGRRVRIAHGTVLTPHVLEGRGLFFEEIQLGEGAQVLEGSVVLSRVTVGEGAVIEPNSLVIKGTRIGPRERFGGVPAKRQS